MIEERSSFLPINYLKNRYNFPFHSMWKNEEHTARVLQPLACSEPRAHNQWPLTRRLVTRYSVYTLQVWDSPPDIFGIRVFETFQFSKIARKIEGVELISAYMWAPGPGSTPTFLDMGRYEAYASSRTRIPRRKSVCPELEFGQKKEVRL